MVLLGFAVFTERLQVIGHRHDDKNIIDYVKLCQIRLQVLKLISKVKYKQNSKLHSFSL